MKSNYLKIPTMFGVALILSACTQPTFQNSNNPSQAMARIEPKPTPYQVTGSLLSLLNGENKECSWSAMIQDNNVQGVVYVADQKFRAEATTRISFFPVTGTAVGNGTEVTAWASIAPDQKVTYPYGDLQKMREQVQESANTQNPVLQEIMKTQEFTCKQWTPDQSKFTI